MRPLRERELKFVNAVCQGKSYRSAAKLAGYASPEKQGSRLAQRPEIKAEIEARTHETTKQVAKAEAKIIAATREYVHQMYMHIIENGWNAKSGYRDPLIALRSLGEDIGMFGKEAGQPNTASPPTPEIYTAAWLLDSKGGNNQA